MSLDLDFAYAQARIQGRFSRLSAEDEWQRLAASRSLHRKTLEDLCGWVPAPWRDALSWTRWLVHLPLIVEAIVSGRESNGKHTK